MNRETKFERCSGGASDAAANTTRLFPKPGAYPPGLRARRA
jgi:hypothetical protein